ncbi:MAG: hypothetical protein HYX68_00735 [Planctomycetes bacterium]|nr:hypothetical protein [Planctomycetota bacterium]
MVALQYVLIAIAVGIALLWLFYAACESQKIDTPNALHILRYGPVLRSAALLVAVGPPMVMACVIWLSTWNSMDRLALAGVSFLATSVAGGFLLFEVEGVQIVLTEQGVIRNARWRREVSIPWTDVEKVGYSTLNRWFVVWASGRAICVSRHMIGVRAFVEMARRKVRLERCAEAAKAMERV